MILSIMKYFTYHWYLSQYKGLQMGNLRHLKGQIGDKKYFGFDLEGLFILNKVAIHY